VNEKTSNILMNMHFSVKHNTNIISTVVTPTKKIANSIILMHTNRFTSKRNDIIFLRVATRVVLIYHVFSFKCEFLVITLFTSALHVSALGPSSGATLQLLGPLHLSVYYNRSK
jgi:hypothetical protein